MPHCSDHHCFVGTAMLKLTNVKTTLLTHCIGRRLKQQPFEKVGQKHLIIFLLIKKLYENSKIFIYKDVQTSMFYCYSAKYKSCQMDLLAQTKVLISDKY